MSSTRLGFGQYIDQPVSGVPTDYLIWVCSQKALCNKFSASIRVALAELRRRFNDADRVEVDLLSRDLI